MTTGDSCGGDAPPAAPGTALGRLRLRTHSGLDRLTLAAGNLRRLPQPTAEEHRTRRGQIEATTAHLTELGWFDDPARAHPDPQVPTDVRFEGARAAGLDFQHVQFSSTYQPPPGDPTGTEWQALTNNRTAHAWMLRHPGPDRPWIVAIHGTAMGIPLVDLVGLRAGWLFRVHGLNVMMPVLPLHGPRKVEGTELPGLDALHNLHGVLQAVHDVRGVLAWLRLMGAPAIGVTGISLGGMITALIGDLEADLRAVIPGAAVAELGLLIQQHSTEKVRQVAGFQLEAGRTFDRITSPLVLPPATPWEHRYIYSGVGDRMVDPQTHGRRIWEHWGRPDACWYPGSHAGLMYSRHIARYLHHAFLSSGLWRPQ